MSNINSIEIEAMINGIVKSASKESNPESVINSYLHYIAKYLLAERCCVFEEKNGSVYMTYEWNAVGLKSRKGEMQAIPISKFAYLYEELESGNSIVKNIEEIKERSPFLYALLRSFGISTTVTSPLVEQGNIIGFVVLDNPSAVKLSEAALVLETLSYGVMTALRQRNLEKLTNSDYLTGFGNRRAMYNYLESLEKNQSLGLVFGDVVGLKRKNDIEGHAAGDELLKGICKCIREVFPNDEHFRIGGDEFIVLCPGIEQRELNKKVLNLDMLIRKNGMNMSIGASWDSTGFDPVRFEEQLNLAEEKMYEAKAIYYKESGDTHSKDLRLNEVPVEWDAETPHEEHYFVALHYCNENEEAITDEQQKVIDKLLVANAGVGIISGLFDENYSIKYISGLALSALGFEYYHDFSRQTRKQMASMFDSDIEKSIFEKVINEENKDGYIITMVGYGWLPVHMRVMGSKSKTADGEDMWIVSVRKMNELQVSAADEHDAILNSLDDTALFVITENEHKLLYFNQRVAELTPNAQVGVLCRELWDDACEKGPISIIGQNQVAKMINYDTVFGELVEVTATRIMWKGEIPAFLMRITPLKEVSTDNIKTIATQNRDYVTGAYNRTGFRDVLQSFIDQGGDLRKFVIVFLNIKGFKAINSLCGSDAGDKLLRTIYNTISDSFLAPRFGARKESDHFIFLVEREKLDLKLLPSILDFKWKLDKREINICCRCGIYYPKQRNENIQDAVNRARLAKDYINDSIAQHFVVFDDAMESDYVQRAKVIANYEDALKNDEFKLYYQPVFDAKTLKPVSAEALVRWINPEKGLILPSVFIPTLEEYGYISKLDHFVVENVADFMQLRQDGGLKNVPISVNLSQMDFYDEWLVDEIRRKTLNSTLPADSIRYEITETAYNAIESLKYSLFEDIRSAGKKILLDDFGTGYSSFAMIQNFEFDILKIDIAFVRQLDTNHKVRSIVETIINMCHDLGIQVVAEGVETKTQLDFLMDKNCDFVQGFYFSKPLNQQQFEAFLEENL